ncbi:hypothetical protein [Planctellipticum variicoloris]|jgi:hypothetical protein|uniref:hypothetical protein n=1 Tax=Planctellipticum variicoloris TaxID=3064265 RepID=UPI002C2FD542|nr:hypothetical protein SH412_000501 [Planctomycetaceae bacterium SH412]HTN04205.1 hypothetical protein [Planctomycetaceae bacterium]
MKRFLASLAAAVVMTAGLAVSAGEVTSGLDKGASVPPFYVYDVTGPQKGSELCYRCRYGNQPVVSIFAKEMNDEVAALAKELDGVVAKHRDERMAGFVVLMSDKPEAARTTLADAAKKNKIEQLPLTTFDGTAGPDGYKINPKADVTVMMWVEGKVTSSHAFNKGELTKDAISKVVKASDALVK